MTFVRHNLHTSSELVSARLLRNIRTILPYRMRRSVTQTHGMFKGRHCRDEVWAIKTARRSKRLEQHDGVPHDAILPMQEPYMQQFGTGEKPFEFRRYRIRPEVGRIWFYRTASHSSIEYVCKILQARTRTSNDEPLEEDGIGNRECSQHHGGYAGHEFAYKIPWVYRLDQPIMLADLRSMHGMMSAPRGLIYTPLSILEAVDWRNARKLRWIVERFQGATFHASIRERRLSSAEYQDEGGGGKAVGRNENV